MILIKNIRSFLEEAARRAFADYDEVTLKMEVALASQEKFGHYQCNSAMKLAKELKRPPREIAQHIVQNIDHSIFERIEIMGPGFINLSLKAAFLSEQVNAMAKDARLGVPRLKQPKRVIVEFSSPNIAKEMHVGHLRSTIIGDALARLFEFLGHDVVRLNHIGDWGTAFGMLIAYMKEEHPAILSSKEKADLTALMHYYRESKKRFDEDLSFKERARNAVVALQGGDAEALASWEVICAISREAFEKVYELLDVHLQERGESYYNPMLPKIVADLEEKGLVTLSEGAKCIFHEGYAIPLMVQKSDGGYNYDTTDMAAMLHRIKEEKAERIIIVTDAGQRLHFELIRKTAERAGYLDPASVRFDHVPFGVVLASDGKKFRTRSGETEKLIDLLQRSIEEARKILLEREPEMEGQEVDKLAHILGLDAVKYADLCCNRVSDYVFSYERMLRFDGNTAAFILYSYVRINGIKRKSEQAHTPTEGLIALKEISEQNLGLHLLRFAEVLSDMEQDLMPHYLTDYLYLLAQKFNHFFRDCQVVGSVEEASRLQLCELVGRTIAQGLHLLGIKTVERM